MAAFSIWDEVFVQVVDIFDHPAVLGSGDGHIIDHRENWRFGSEALVKKKRVKANRFKLSLLIAQRQWDWRCQRFSIDDPIASILVQPQARAGVENMNVG